MFALPFWVASFSYNGGVSFRKDNDLAMKILTLLVAGIFSLGLSNSLFAETLRDPGLHFFEDTFGDMQEELQLTDEEGKTGLLIMFETDECPWCVRMKQTVLNRVKVQDYYKANFRSLTLNAESSNTLVDFDGNETTEADFALKLLRVRATPVFAFFAPSGALLTKFTGTTKNVQDFLLLGKFVVEGHYASQRFSQYRRAQQG